MHDDRVAVGRGFRLDPRLSPARKDQQAALGARLLDRGAHERVEQFLQHDLAGDGLRHLDHGREVEVFDRRPDRARRSGCGSSSLRCGYISSSCRTLPSAPQRR